MRKVPSASTLAIGSVCGVLALGALLSMQAAAQQGSGTQDISDAAIQQMATISAFKHSFTDAEKKIDSNLVFAAKTASGQVGGAALSIAGVAGADSETVDVDIYGAVTDTLLADIAAVGGVVSYQSARWETIRAEVPLAALDTLAANADVTSIRTAERAVTNAGALTSQGYITHRANQIVNMGIDGTGVTVGVLSDSALPARVTALIASGDLPAGTTVLPGQAGPSNGSDEGTAMMEIVHDIAPGANLLFATAFTSAASFADNIIRLQEAGASVIVDDITYFDEGAFQDGIIARAVNEVTARGAVYLSAAANSGNLTLNTSGTWEGDFRDNGPIGGVIAGLGETGTVHNFGTAAAPQNYDILTVPSDVITLKWSDPLGTSSNDYDLFILNSAGTVVKGFSVGAQDGRQNPYERISEGTACGTSAARGYCPAAGDRIVVVLYDGVQRALRLDTNRGQLSIKTAGSTFGHNAAANTITTAATYWNSARTGTRPFVGASNPIEIFSSDGPRKMFFNPDGTPLTPGNLLFSTNGGVTLQKPDIAAADGVSTKTPGFLPFYGTSAAAPHAAGIAALILSARPGWTPAQVAAAMKSSALDSMAPGVDRDSGYGIAMAWSAVQYALTH